MKLIHAILLLVAISVSGCAILHVKQYRIAGVTANSPDAVKLKVILQNVADKTGLNDHTSDSTMTNVFVFYAQSDVHNPPNLGAWFYQGDVWIQIFGGYGKPPAYKEANRLLQPMLRDEFGSRFSNPSEPFSRIESAPQKN